MWAPGVLNSHQVYYSIARDERMGLETAHCVGVVNITGTAPNLDWVDAGEPVACSFNAEEDDEGTRPGAFDPAGFTDTDGKTYVVYGGAHMYIALVDPKTGIPLDDDYTDHSNIANGPKFISATAQEIEGSNMPIGPDGIYWAEAPYMFKHGSYYYVFVNWYYCCKLVGECKTENLFRFFTQIDSFLLYFY